MEINVWGRDNRLENMSTHRGRSRRQPFCCQHRVCPKVYQADTQSGARYLRPILHSARAAHRESAKLSCCLFQTLTWLWETSPAWQRKGTKQATAGVGGCNKGKTALSTLLLTPAALNEATHPALLACHFITQPGTIEAADRSAVLSSQLQGRVPWYFT